MTKRKFVVCFDGTWNTPDKGARPTNVVKMVRAVRCVDAAGLSQVVFYDKDTCPVLKRRARAEA